MNSISLTSLKSETSTKYCLCLSAILTPTFRGSGHGTAHYPFFKIDFERLARYCEKNNAVILSLFFTNGCILNNTTALFFSQYLAKRSKSILKNRGSGHGTAHYPFFKIDFERLARYCEKNNAVVLFKSISLTSLKSETSTKYCLCLSAILSLFFTNGCILNNTTAFSKILRKK
jgi:hypothetical protein